MEEFKAALRSLTQAVCRELEGIEIPKRPVWTVVDRPDSAPYVAMDVSRPALYELRFTLSIGLLKMPEYRAAAEAAESDPELSKGIIINAVGFLHPPERDNNTRVLVTNFLWRYLREGEQLDWDETRFLQTVNELEVALNGKSVVFHRTLPLSNLKMEVARLVLGDELELLPASKEELE